ncbi:MAG: tripartite tricarboxylate transporter substrate-binding protein, partial [Burkholderiales bacterium]
MLDAFGSMEQHVKAGKLRVLAVTRGLEDYPQIPTFQSIYPDYRQPAFIVLTGPAGMSADLTDRINKASASVVTNPKFNQDLAKLRWRNLDGARTPQGTSELIRRARAEWGAFIREIGIQPE